MVSEKDQRARATRLWGKRKIGGKKSEKFITLAENPNYYKKLRIIFFAKKKTANASIGKQSSVCLSGCANFLTETGKLKTVVSAFPGCLGDDRAQLLSDLIGPAGGAFDFLGFSFFQAHNKGEFFTTFFADKFIGRHAVPP